MAVAPPHQKSQDTAQHAGTPSTVIMRQLIYLILVLRSLRYTHSFGFSDGSSRVSSILLSDATNHAVNEESCQMDLLKRRLFLKRSLRTVPLLGLQSRPVNARGLVRFPCNEPLLNTYHFMRAGTSLLEEENVWSTNPLFLTNREAALSDLGESQVRNACKFLASQDINPIVRYSLAAASVDSANIVGDELKVLRFLMHAASTIVRLVVVDSRSQHAFYCLDWS